MKKYTNTDLADDYLKRNSDKDAYENALQIQSCKEDIIKYFNENKSLYNMQIGNISAFAKSRLESILDRKEQTALKSRLKKMRQESNAQPKLNYNKIPSNIRGEHSEDSFP